jgi:hypothetical protein
MPGIGFCMKYPTRASAQHRRVPAVRPRRWPSTAGTGHRCIGDRRSATGFEAIVRASGWYELFEQTNASGEIDTFANVMEHALSL